VYNEIGAKTALTNKPLRNLGLKPLRIQNCLSRERGQEEEQKEIKPSRRTKSKGEFFEFRFYVKILGLVVTALIFWLLFYQEKSDVK
jgi:hypothetical protein